ncbi:hypothetical protein EG832_05000 [bacterium]|nr:hypothetical protein [bacterium]
MPDFDPVEEYRLLKQRLENVIGQTDPRLDGDYILMGCREAMLTWCIYTEGAFGNYEDKLIK